MPNEKTTIDLMNLAASAQQMKGIPTDWLATIQIVQAINSQSISPLAYILAVEGVENIMIDEIPDEPKRDDAGKYIPDKNGKIPEYWLRLDKEEQRLVKAGGKNWADDTAHYFSFSRVKYRELWRLIKGKQSKRIQGSLKREAEEDVSPD